MERQFKSTDLRNATFAGRSLELAGGDVWQRSSTTVSKRHSLRMTTAERPNPFYEHDRFVSPNRPMSDMCDFRLASRGWTGGVSRAPVTSRLLDRARKEGNPKLYKTHIGFKLIGDRFNEDKTILACDESSTPSIKGHYAEKDGIPACLLPAQKVATHRGVLPEESTALYSCLARLEVVRSGMRLPPERASPLRHERWKTPGKSKAAKSKRLVDLIGKNQILLMAHR